MDTKTYQTTPATLQTLSAELASHGIQLDPSQPSGAINQGGWDLSYATPQAGRIAITVVKHPFAEEGIFWGKVAGILGDPVTE